MKRWQLVRNTGILLIFLVVLSNIPYILLIQTFEYDDILRQPVDYVLTQFHAGGARLILTWFTFGLAALLFIPASIMLHLALAREDKIYLPIATFMGAMSGICKHWG